MENKDGIDKLFREKLNTLERDTPYDAWPDMEKALARGTRKKRMTYWRYGSVAAALLLAFFTGYFFNYQTSRPIEEIKRTGRPSIERTVPKQDPEPTETTQPETTPKKNDSGSTRIPKVNTRGESATPEKEHRAYSDPAKDLTLRKPAKIHTKENSASTGLSPGLDGAETPLAISEVPRIRPDVLEPPSISEARKAIERSKAPLISDAPVIATEVEPNSLEPSIPPRPEQEALPSLEPAVAETLAALNLSDEPGNRSPKRSTNTVEVSLLAAATLPFVHVSYKEDDPITRSNVQNERLENSYATGVKVLVQTPANWEWQAGLIVNNWVQSSNNILLNEQPSSPTNTPTVTNSSNEVSGYVSTGDVQFEQNSVKEVAVTEDLRQFYLVPNIAQQYQFVEIPLGAAYYLTRGRFEIKMQTGLNTRLLSRSSVVLEYPDGSTESYEGLKPRDVSLQISAGPGFAYRFTKHLKLTLDPLVYYGVTPVNTSNNVDTYYHQILFFSGLSYRF